MSRKSDDPTPEFASPPCFLHEIDPAYSGLSPANPQEADAAPQSEDKDIKDAKS